MFCEPNLAEKHSSIHSHQFHNFTFQNVIVLFENVKLNIKKLLENHSLPLLLYHNLYSSTGGRRNWRTFYILICSFTVFKLVYNANFLDKTVQIIFSIRGSKWRYVSTTNNKRTPYSNFRIWRISESKYWHLKTTEIWRTRRARSEFIRPRRLCHHFY